MADIFISYAHEDRPWVQSLAAALESAGFSVWWDGKLPAGVSFSKETHAALEAATLVIVVWSRASIQSHWVLDEAGVGRDRDALVPVMRERCEIPLGFRQVQAKDLSGRPVVKNTELSPLIADIADRLRRPVRQRDVQRRRMPWRSVALLALAGAMLATIIFLLNGIPSNQPVVTTFDKLSEPEALAAACDGGDAVACRRLGEMYANGETVRENSAEARKRLEQACNGGDVEGCENLAYLCVNGIGGPKDLVKARNILEPICANGDMRSCHNIGEILVELGTEADIAAALEYYEKACALDGGPSCAKAASMYFMGKGTPVDKVKARALFARACDNRIAEGCFAHSLMLEAGDGGPRDPETAGRQRAEACNLGLPQACDE